MDTPKKKSSEKRVTLEDLARATGISRSAASKAMRNHPEVSRTTCEKVQKFAKQLGYVRDPALSRLAHYRWNQVSSGYGESVAYIFPARSPRDRPQLIVGTLQRIFNEVGFDFQTFHAKDHTPEQLSRVLRARGIKGVIFHRITHAALAHRLCESGFTCVALAEGPVLPPCELIRQDFLLCLKDAVKRHREVGHERLVYVLRLDNRDTPLGDTLKAIWSSLGLPVEHVLYHDLSDEQQLIKSLQIIEPDGIIFQNWVKMPNAVWKNIGGHDPSREIVLRLVEKQLGMVNGYYVSDERLVRRAAYYLESQIKREGRDELYGVTLLRPEWVAVKSSS